MHLRLLKQERKNANVFKKAVSGRKRNGRRRGRLGRVLLYAQDWARQAVDKSPRRREWVSVKHDGRSVESFVAHRNRRPRRPRWL